MSVFKTISICIYDVLLNNLVKAEKRKIQFFQVKKQVKRYIFLKNSLQEQNEEFYHLKPNQASTITISASVMSFECFVSKFFIPFSSRAGLTTRKSYTCACFLVEKYFERFVGGGIVLKIACLQYLL
jgi:hypothetical protein